ncbi:MAG: TIGR01777 family oxidoreductase [Candidatus Sumerlaeia bacterium]
MKILISGSHGLIGTALAETLEREGFVVGRLVRRREEAGGANIYWNYEDRQIDRDRLEGWDAVVHLAGENIAVRRWTEARKARLLNSRKEGTFYLALALSALHRKPRTLVSASATGYYGDSGDKALNESAPPGRGFLAHVCQEWEAAARPAASAGIRVVHPRLGVVLSAKSGALAKMLPAFRWGLGGRLGHGRQYMSWIHIQDAVQAIIFLITNRSLSGPVNVTAPRPVENREFTRTLGRVLGRPAIMPVPAALMRLAFGQMAAETMLASNRVLPSLLQQAGFVFQFPELEPALRDLLNTSR